MSKLSPPGPVMFDLAGPCLSENEARWLEHPAAAGIILFSRNFESPQQLARLTGEIREIRRDALIAVDHEGGRVQRFRNGFTRLPPAAQYLLHTAGDVARAAELARDAGWVMAAELLALGVDFSFAPVLDVESGVSTVIGDRAFASDPEAAAQIALAFRQGMRDAGMAAVGKHFPGHGGVAADSHVTLPIDERSRDDLNRRDLAPFRQAVAAGIEAMMPAHVVYPSFDALPAGFSRYWLQDVLRNEWGFSGAIISDDLSMLGAASVAESYEERVRVALAAGCDMVIVCRAAEHLGAVLGIADEWVGDTDRSARLARLRGRTTAGGAIGTADHERWRQNVSALAAVTKAGANLGGAALVEIQTVRDQAECLYTEAEVEASIARVAQAIDAVLRGTNPLLLCVLNGGVVFAGKLLTHLDFPLQLEAVMATRYQGATVGDRIEWLLQPRRPLQGRHVLVIDDILDEGITLAEIMAYCRERGAASVRAAVLVEKQLDHAKPSVADFVGLCTPNRYLFGYGMDYKTYWRNAAGIFACRESED